MKIGIVPERYGAVLSPCASIRIASFFDVLARDPGCEIRYLLMQEVEAYRPDILVWHRTALADVAQVDAVHAIARRTGMRLVYDLDDNLLDIAEHGEADAYRSKVEAIERSLRIADEVWCSTEPLASRVADVMRHPPAVLTNVLDPDLWRVCSDDTATKPGPLRLLYMGTRTHDDDLALLVEAIHESGLGDTGQVQLSTVGVRARDAVVHPWQADVAMPPHLGASYPAFVRWFRQLRGYDAGVAPLISGAFNDCKSSIKVLDYAAIGLATLASDMPAYSADARDGRCVLVRNDIRAWANALVDLVEDRRRLADAMAVARGLVTPERHVAAVELRRRRLEEVTC